MHIVLTSKYNSLLKKSNRLYLLIVLKKSKRLYLLIVLKRGKRLYLLIVLKKQVIVCAEYFLACCSFWFTYKCSLRIQWSKTAL